MITLCKTLGLSTCFFASSYPLHIALRILFIKALPAVYPCVHRALRDGQVRGGTAQIIRCLTSPFAFYLCLSALICGCFSSVSYASPPSADVHFCLPLESKDMRARDSIYAATKHALNLNVGEPRTVRMIYFLPNDRPFRQEVVDSMKVTIRQIQTFFAEQMQAHGHGNKTFRFETDAQGDPLVHRVDGQHLDSHYLDNTYGTVAPEINQIFNVYENIYFTVIDNSTDLIDRRAGGVAEQEGKNGGITLFPGGFSWTTAAHELGHAFGLQHDFNDAYLMSYGSYPDRLSACHAEFLAVHPYFNPDIPIEDAQSPTIELISSREYPTGSQSVSIQLKVSDLEGLHQVILFVRTREPHFAAGFLEVKACRGLAGEKDAVVEFEYDGVIPSSGFTSLFDSAVHSISVEAVDIGGHVSRADFELWEISPYHIITHDGHTDEVFSVAFSPDRTMVASGSADKTVRLWNVAPREIIATLEEHTSEVRVVAFSPDSTTLASGSFRDVRLWNIATGETIATPEAYSQVWSIAFSPDGTILAYADWSRVRLWDVATRHDIGVLQGHTSIISSIAFSPDGTILASGSWDGTIKLWDVARGRNIATFEHQGVSSVAFSPDGAMLASGSNDATVKLWNMPTGETIATILAGDRGNTGAVSVTFSPDGTILASGSTDNMVKIWDVTTREIIATIRGHRGIVHDVEFSPDGTTLASGASDGTVILWDTSEWARPRPRSLVKISGDNQQGTPGADLANPFIVEVRDQYGDPLQGAQVAFAVTAGDGKVGGRFRRENATTNANGQAASTLTLGPNPGTNIVKVYVAGIRVSFNAVGVGTPPTSMDDDYHKWSLPDGATARLGKGSVSESKGAIAFSPDGQCLAVASNIGIWLYDVATSRELALLTGHTSVVPSVSFSPDGATLASGSYDHTVKLWDVATGQNIATFEGHTSGVESVAFLSNGKILASGSYDHTVRLWDVATGQNIAILNIIGSSVAYSPNGTMLAAGVNYDSYSQIKLWDVATGQNIATLEGHKGSVHSIAYSPDGTTLASGAEDRKIKLWDVATGQNIATLEGHTRSVESIAFSPDGTILASGAWDKKIKLWNVATGENVTTLEWDTGWVASVAFSPDGTTLASWAWDGTIKLWDIVTKNIVTLEGHMSPVKSVAFSPDGTTLASGPLASSVKLWDIATGQNITTLERSANFVTFSLHGKMLATISEVGGVLLWDVATRTNIATLNGHRFWVECIAFSFDGTTLASGSQDRTVKLWDVATGESSTTFEGHTGEVSSVAFSPDGTILASGSSDNTIRLWDVSRRTNTATLEGHTNTVHSVTFSPDGITLASGSDDGTILLWNVETRQNIATLDGHTDRVYAVAFSPDGVALASVSGDHTVKLWDAVIGHNIATLRGHSAWIRSVAFSHDGMTLASGSDDGTVLLWDMSQYVTPVVNISDANLRAVIRDALGKSRFAPITVTDMASLTTLDASNRNIRELDGLEFATNLTALNLADNPLSAPAINTHIPILQDRGIEVLFDKIPSSDFDGDGTVGIADFLLFVAQFEFSEDDKGYEARFDLDGDGIIGIADFLIFANAFGKAVSSN